MVGQRHLFILLLCLIGFSMQACPDCKCCKGKSTCDSNKHCKEGCIAGYYGKKCTQDCPENCQTCEYKYSCQECKPGYFTNYCNTPCGKGCLNNTCAIKTGQCECKSTDFQKGKCEYCADNKYGDVCNKTCPSNCGTCSSSTDCSWCKDTLYYGPYCQHKCSHGCEQGTCTKRNGHCIKGCKVGYKGDKCDSCSENRLYGMFCNLTCIAGTYGDNCSKLCTESDVNCRACSSNELGQYGGCIQCNSGYYPGFTPGRNYNACLSCPVNCRGNECNSSEICSGGCLRGKWGGNCSNDCVFNCLECKQTDGKCLVFTNKTFSQNCSPDCNFTGSGKICANETGKCLQGCKTFFTYGDYCEKECHANCYNKSCDWKTGHCTKGCVMNNYGSFCDKKCANSCQSKEDQSVCDDGDGHCLYGCLDGFYGSSCENNCSSQCINISCDSITGKCLYGCMKGNEGQQCYQAIKGTGSGSKFTTIIIVVSASVAIIALIVLSVLFLIKRRKCLSSHKICELNGNMQDLPELRQRRLETETDAANAQPFKTKRQGDEGIKEYDTATDNDSNNEYAVINNGDIETIENIEEVYDTTKGNKNKRLLDTKNEYAVLSLKSAKPVDIDKSNGKQLEEEDDIYNTTKENINKTLLNPVNDYASITCYKGEKTETDIANQLYDTTCVTKKNMLPGNNDYDVFCM